jgi:hypothetical protein
MKPILLCEGASGSFVPTTGYCRQGEKVWFAFGKPAKLDESFSSMTLVESIDSMELEERQLPDGRTIKTPKGGVWVVEGPAQASDKRNANNRYYPRSIWEKWIKDSKSPAQQAIRERAMVGHLEHPADGRTDGNKLGLVVTHAELREDGDVHARFELLDTPEGLRLQEYTRKGVKWGVSSRGTGSVDEKGRVSPDDYVLETWDAVMRPSVSGAHPRLTQSESDQDPAPARGSVAEDSKSGASAALDSDVTSCVESVATLCGSSIDELDETGRRDLRTSLLRAGRQLRTAPSNTRVQEALVQVLCKLSVLEEAGADHLDDLIESAVRDATQGEDAPDHAEAAQAIQELREAHRATAEEAEELRAKLEGAESALVTSRWRVQELTGQLAEANSRYEAQASKLQTAEALLAERPAREISGHVQEAIDEALRQVPNLSSFREILEGAETADKVFDFAEQLLPLAMRATTPAVGSPQPAAVPIVEDSRPTLPRGAVRSENDAGKRIEESRRTPSSRGSRLAAAAAGVRK